MSQSTLGPLVPSQTTGSELASILRSTYDASITAHSGTKRPTYAKAGTQWLNTSVSPWALNFYTGSVDATLFRINPTTGAITLGSLGGNFETSGTVRVGAANARGATLEATAGASGIYLKRADGTNQGSLSTSGADQTVLTSAGSMTLTTGSQSVVFQADGNVIFGAAAGGEAISTIRNRAITAQASADSKLPIAGGHVTGQISLVDANLRLTRGGSQRFIVCDGTNMGFAGQDGNYDLYVNDGGAVWTAQMGDLYTHIEGRASAWAQNAVNNANGKFEQIRLTGFGYTASNSYNTVGSGYVITGINKLAGQAGDVAGLHYAQIQGFSPSRGWVAAFND